MIKAKNIYAVVTVVIAAILLMLVGGCEKKADPDRKTSYTLEVQDELGVTGTATFIETGNTESTITLQLYGAPAGTHPAALYMNTIAEGGTIVIELNPVEDSGTSTTILNTLSYDQLIEYDGHIKIVKSSSEPGVILAQADIGGNVITDTNVSYTLETMDAYGVSGTALFEKRENENTLVTLTLDGTIEGEVYPATINLSSIETIGGGPVTKTLSSVDGTTGKSYTNIRNLDEGLNITYDNWLTYDGYINIYQTTAEFENIISQGNIGSNLK